MRQEHIIWASMTRSKKKLYYVSLFFKAKLMRDGKCRYLNFVKWYLHKMDWGIELEKKFVQKNIFMDFFDRFLGKFCIILENTPTLALHIFLDITPTVFLLHTMKESLVWSSQNTHKLNEFDQFSMFNSCPKLRDFKVFTTYENLSTSDAQHLCQNGQINIC